MSVAGDGDGDAGFRSVQFSMSLPVDFHLSPDNGVSAPGAMPHDMKLGARVSDGKVRQDHGMIPDRL